MFNIDVPISKLKRDIQSEGYPSVWIWLNKNFITSMRNLKDGRM